MLNTRTQRPMEKTGPPHRLALLAACICALSCGGCLPRKPPATHPPPIAFAHPVVPVAIAAASLEDAPNLDVEPVPPPKLASPRSAPPRPRVAQSAPAEPAAVEKAPDPVIVPDLSKEQVNTAKSETEHSLEIAEWNLAQTQGKKLNTAQEDVASKVRGFMDTARDAMKNSDWQRAKNLAKKAEVLSHELAANL